MVVYTALLTMNFEMKSCQQRQEIDNDGFAILMETAMGSKSKFCFGSADRAIMRQAV